MVLEHAVAARQSKIVTANRRIWGTDNLPGFGLADQPVFSFNMGKTSEAKWGTSLFRVLGCDFKEIGHTIPDH